MLLTAELTQEWYQLTRAELITEIKKRRETIRSHRDAVGDYRCWVDDYKLWEHVLGLATFPEFNEQEFMRRCEEFFTHRKSENPDPKPQDAISKKSLWDNDLEKLPTATLRGELLKIQWAIENHCIAPTRGERLRNTDDDRKLYSILPERLPADFRLPDRDNFLGNALYPHAGCPAFWDSHKNCTDTKHDFNVWGPCK